MGKKSKLTSREKSIIVCEAKKEPKATSNEIKKAAGPIGEKVSAVPVRRVILAFGLKAFRPIKKPLMTAAYKINRFLWAQAHRR